MNRSLHPVMPPSSFKRVRSWDVFAKRFEPVERDDETCLWEPDEVPKDADYRHWWTVVDGDRGRLVLLAGFHLVNRVGYVQCRVPWGGEANKHPDYLY